MQSALISNFQGNKQPDLLMNIPTSLASVISVLLLSSCGQGQGQAACNLQVINQDHDSSSSQRIFSEVDKAIRSHSVNGGVKVKVELVVSQLELSREGERRRRLFYVLTDGGGRFMDASTCDVDEGQCAVVIVKKMVDLCGRA